MKLRVLMPSVILFLSYPAGALSSTEMKMTPDVSLLDHRMVAPINKVVGYYIDPRDINEDVSFSGSADKSLFKPGATIFSLFSGNIVMRPYRDLEPSIKIILYNTFAHVRRLDSAHDQQELVAKQISYVFIPKIRIRSDSTPQKWSQNEFEVAIDLVTTDANGREVWKTSSTGRGHATDAEFSFNDLSGPFTDPAIAAKRASLEALREMQKTLDATSAFRD